MNSLDLTPTWAGLLPALFAMLESGTGEGPAIARQELSRLAAFADSANAAAKEERAKEELAAQRGRGLAADSLAGFARDFMTQGAFMRAACYWEAAARIAPAGMEAARDFRVSADLAEREAAALSRHGFQAARIAAWNEGYNARCDDESGNPDKPTLNPYQAPALTL